MQKVIDGTGIRTLYYKNKNRAQVPGSEKIFVTPKFFSKNSNFWAIIRFLRKNSKIEFLLQNRMFCSKIEFCSTPIGDHKIFFGTRDLRQSISRARKPPSTKNQPIWRRKKIFFGEGPQTAPLPPLRLDLSPLVATFC